MFIYLFLFCSKSLVKMGIFGSHSKTMKCYFQIKIYNICFPDHHMPLAWFSSIFSNRKTLSRLVMNVVLENKYMSEFKKC